MLSKGGNGIPLGMGARGSQVRWEPGLLLSSLPWGTKEDLQELVGSWR